MMASVVLAAPTPRPPTTMATTGILRRLGAVGLGRIDGERLQPVRRRPGSCRSGIFPAAAGRSRPSPAGCGRRRALSAASPAPITTSWRAPLEPSMMVTVLCSPAAASFGAACCVADSLRRRGGRLRPRRAFRLRWRRAASRSDDRLAAERIVVEDGEAREGHQKQAEQHRERLHGGERQPKPPLAGAACPVRAGRSDRRPFLPCAIPNQSRPTIPRRGQAAAGRQQAGDVRSSKQKGRPEGRPFRSDSRWCA